jgi:hypothetical protein
MIPAPWRAATPAAKSGPTRSLATIRRRRVWPLPVVTAVGSDSSLSSAHADQAAATRHQRCSQISHAFGASRRYQASALWWPSKPRSRNLLQITLTADQRPAQILELHRLRTHTGFCIDIAASAPDRLNTVHHLHDLRRSCRVRQRPDVLNESSVAHHRRRYARATNSTFSPIRASFEFIHGHQRAASAPACTPPRASSLDLYGVVVLTRQRRDHAICRMLLLIALLFWSNMESPPFQRGSRAPGS